MGEYTKDELMGMKKDELKAILDDLEIVYNDDMTKDDLSEAILSYYAESQEDPEDAPQDGAVTEPEPEQEDEPEPEQDDGEVSLEDLIHVLDKISDKLVPVYKKTKANLVATALAHVRSARDRLKDSIS